MVTKFHKLPPQRGGRAKGMVGKRKRRLKLYAYWW